MGSIAFSRAGGASLCVCAAEAEGLAAIHGAAAWNIAGRYMDLLGGAANWHPPGLTFTVNIADSAHPALDGVADFEVEDEIYMTASRSRRRNACDSALAESESSCRLGEGVRRWARLLHGSRTWSVHF